MDQNHRKSHILTKNTGILDGKPKKQTRSRNGARQFGRTLYWRGTLSGFSLNELFRIVLRSWWEIYRRGKRSNNGRINQFIDDNVRDFPRITPFGQRLVFFSAEPPFSRRNTSTIYVGIMVEYQRYRRQSRDFVGLGRFKEVPSTDQIGESVGKIGEKWHQKNRIAVLEGKSGDQGVLCPPPTQKVASKAL